MIELGAMVDLFLAGAGTARNAWSNKSTEKETQQLAVRYWGQVLFEMRENLEGIKRMSDSDSEIGYYPILRFRAWDELFSILCKLAPMPRMLASVQKLNNLMEEIAFLLRTGIGSSTIIRDLGSLGSQHERGGANQWRDAFAQAAELVKAQPEVQFNTLRDIVASAGRKAFGEKEWQIAESEMLPDIL